MESCITFRNLLATDCLPIVGAYNGLVAKAIKNKGNIIFIHEILKIIQIHERKFFFNSIK